MTKGDTRHTLLFDAGPDGAIWKDNVQRLQLTKALGDIEAIHLSHWHRDHSGKNDNIAFVMSLSVAELVCRRTRGCDSNDLEGKAAGSKQNHNFSAPGATCVPRDNDTEWPSVLSSRPNLRAA